MSELVKQIEHGYADIALATSLADAASAYTEFHQLLEAEQPDVDVLVQLNASPAQARAFEHVRNVSCDVFHRGDSAAITVFRGTGALVLGTGDGEIVGFDYKGEPDDPVAEQYGSYQRVAIRKLGQGVLLSRTDIPGTTAEDKYDELEAILVENGLKPEAPKHHLGYAFNRLGGAVLAAGASGMLPTSGLHRDMEIDQDVDRIINIGYQQELLEWDKDELAGFYDHIAAEILVGNLDQSYATRPAAYKMQDAIRRRFNAGQNLH